MHTKNFDTQCQWLQKTTVYVRIEIQNTKSQNFKICQKTHLVETLHITSEYEEKKKRSKNKQQGLFLN